jgi:hypothetical protein
MGRSRQRNKLTSTFNRHQAQPIRVNIPVTATVTCPGGERAGLDVRAVATIRRLDNFLCDIRVNLTLPNGASAEDSATKLYLTYLSVLVDVGLTDMVVSAIHDNDIAVIMKQRMLVEYSAKGRWYNKHRDHALHLMTIDLAHHILKKTKNANPDSERIVAFQKR